MSNQHIEIVPSNVTSDGTISFKDGQPVFQFIIGEQNRYLLGQSIRLVGEFNVLSKYIKSGDFILAHDYAENKEVFEEKIKGKIWNWHEISDSDISQATLENNLEIYNKDTFENVVWTCRKKI